MLLNLDYTTVDVPGFDGVTADVKPLSVGAYQTILRLMGKMYGGEKQTDISAVLQLGEAEMSTAIKDILPAHVDNIHGLQVRESGKIRDAKVEDIVQYGALLPVAVSILTLLFSRAQLGENDEKNSEGQSVNS